MKETISCKGDLFILRSLLFIATPYVVPEPRERERERERKREEEKKRGRK